MFLHGNFDCYTLHTVREVRSDIAGREKNEREELGGELEADYSAFFPSCNHFSNDRTVGNSFLMAATSAE